MNPFCTYRRHAREIAANPNSHACEALYVWAQYRRTMNAQCKVIQDKETILERARDKFYWNFVPPVSN